MINSAEIEPLKFDYFHFELKIPTFSISFLPFPHTIQDAQLTLNIKNK
jgi:hypothetical protein